MSFTPVCMPAFRRMINRRAMMRNRAMRGYAARRGFDDRAVRGELRSGKAGGAWRKLLEEQRREDLSCWCTDISWGRR